MNVLTRNVRSTMTLGSPVVGSRFGNSRAALKLATIVLLACLPLCAAGQQALPKQASERVASLKLIERRVAAVVASNLPACVAISDGVGFGTGVVVSRSGLILTAAHVMGTGTADDYEIIFPSGRTATARSLGKNLNADAGMLQLIGPGPWPYVDLCPHDDLALGDWVVSLGHSGGFELGRDPPVRVGRILKLKSETIKTDAVLIGGDSGGPLFNLDGQLIAIHTSIGDIAADNRHVTLATFRRDWQRMQRGDAWGKLKELNEPGDKTKPGRMGVQMDRKAARAEIRSVKRGSGAAEAGILAGDVVVQFDNIIINDGGHLIEVVRRFHAGEVIDVKIDRGGVLMQLEVQLR